MDEADAPKEDTPKRKSPVQIFCLLAVMSVAQMFQYVMANLMVAKLPGNKFLNGILLGTAESAAMVFSRLLLSHLNDM